MVYQHKKRISKIRCITTKKVKKISPQKEQVKKGVSPQKISKKKKLLFYTNGILEGNLAWIPQEMRGTTE